MSARSSRLLVVQPYVPSYRVPLFRRMKAELLTQDIQLKVAAAPATGMDKSRADDQTTGVADFILPIRRIQFGAKALVWKSLSTVLRDYKPDFVIVEQAIRNLESWLPLLSQRLPKRPHVAMWGQGRAYSTPQSQMEARVRLWLTRQSSWFFAYTDMGAKYLSENHYPAERISILWNSNDSEALRRELTSIHPEEVEGFRRRRGLTKGRTALFLGGVDSRKGIRFLLDTAHHVAESLPDFTLVVAGTGDSVGEVLSEQDRGGPVRFLGRVDGKEKAIALSACDILMVPEWVGLVAIDALVAGKPLATTAHPSHSPEFEYLTLGTNSIITEHRIHEYAAGVTSLLIDKSRLRMMSEACVADSALLTINGMTDRFVAGIVEWRQASQK